MYLPPTAQATRPRNLPVSLRGIPEGVSGIRVTLDVMRRLARKAAMDPKFVQFARALVGDNLQKNWMGEISDVHRFVRDNIRYIRDPLGMEWVQEPVATLETRQGDCDDKVTLAAALLRAIGHPTRFRAVAFTPGRYSHVYLEARVNRGKKGYHWVAVETTEPWELGRAPSNTVGPPIIKDI